MRTVKMCSAAYMGSEAWKNTSHTMRCSYQNLKPNPQFSQLDC